MQRSSTAQWQQMDHHHLHPFTDHEALRSKGARVITRAEGIYLWDSEGNRILDAMSGLWCVNIGYGRKELAEVAYRQMLELPYYNSFFSTTHPPAAELSELLAAVTPPAFNQVLLTSSGSEANDTVVRMVRHYWAKRGEPQRRVIISRDNAYHGSTMAGASLGGMKNMHAQGGLPIPDIVHIPQPYWYGEGRATPPDEFGAQVAAKLAEEIERQGPGKVAAFIAEPIQGAGGVIVPPATYWPAIQRIVREYGILLVADEVICGFGRTGEWFGSEYYGLQPDLMPIAKGMSSGYMPLGGVMVADRVAEVISAGEFAHGFTWSAHPVACAVAKANIEIMRNERIVENGARETAPLLQRKWRELAAHPLVGEARGVGFLGALELVRDKRSAERFTPDGATGCLCRDICAQNGLVMRAVPNDIMVIAPPLTITPAEIDELVALAWKCLDLSAAALKKH